MFGPTINCNYSVIYNSSHQLFHKNDKLSKQDCRKKNSSCWKAHVLVTTTKYTRPSIFHLYLHPFNQKSGFQIYHNSYNPLNSCRPSPLMSLFHSSVTCHKILSKQHDGPNDIELCHAILFAPSTAPAPRPICYTLHTTCELLLSLLTMLFLISPPAFLNINMFVITS